MCALMQFKNRHPNALCILTLHFQDFFFFSFLPVYPVFLSVIDAFTDKGEILVYYYKEQLKDFLPPESWVAAVRRTHTEKQQNTLK